mmetsp:Transcript_45785/g.113769  ORF Transcript_45785/g.113769 Transcript_45785/m.113769 type:complete len:87 (+) Transcript_45785:1580-1840(+)
MSINKYAQPPTHAHKQTRARRSGETQAGGKLIDTLHTKRKVEGIERKERAKTRKREAEEEVAAVCVHRQPPRSDEKREHNKTKPSH